MIEFKPKKKNSAVERIEFIKDDKKITFVNRFDTYAVYSDEDDYEEFDFDSYDPKEGVETGSAFSWVTEEEGERIEWSIEGDISDEEKDELIAAFQEEWESGPEDLGWEWSDREVWFYGPIKVTEDV